MIKKLFFICGFSAAVCFGADKPNVIVILADDLGYADVGFQDETAPGVCTPHLDKLAGDGVVFKQGYAASPVCSNSRLALSTGRYQQRWGAYYYSDGGVPRSEFTIAEMMKEAGYRTMKVGKTHLNDGPKEHPMKHGFDGFLGFIHHSWDFELLSQKDVDAYEKKVPGCTKRLKAPIGPLTRDNDKLESFEDTTTTEVFGQESVKFIEEDSAKPFYLQLEFNAVHTPLHRCPKQLQEKYGVPDRPYDRSAAKWEFPLWEPTVEKHKKWYKKVNSLGKLDPYGRQIYLAHLELMDQQIGRIVTALKKSGQYENTFIFFSSDNGGSHQSYANNGSLYGYKFKLMDGGIRVPMIASWPKGSKKGLRTDAVVTHRDVFATLSEITGVQPKNPLDGKSLLPVMTAKADQLHEDPLFWDSGKTQQNWVVRLGDWKLVFFGKGWSGDVYELDENGLVTKFNKGRIKTGMKLFNMKDDPFEKKNLVKKYPEKVKQMQAMYTQWRSGMGKPIKGRNVK